MKHELLKRQHYVQSSCISHISVNRQKPSTFAVYPQLQRGCHAVCCSEADPFKTQYCCTLSICAFNILSVYVQPEHELRNMHEVLALISRHPKGLLLKRVKDAYKGVGDDVKVHLAAMLQFYTHHFLCYLPAHQRHRTGYSVCSAVLVTATHQFSAPGVAKIVVV